MSIQSLVDQMTLDEKIEAMEVLWKSLSRSPDYKPPEWHGEVLKQRAKEAQENPDAFENLETVKRRLMERGRSK